MKKKLTLGSPFGEGCVLQQGSKTRIWGYGQAGETIEIELQNQITYMCADDKGRFEGPLHELKAGGPFSMQVRASVSEDVVRNEVYVGEVFLTAGQSNAGLPMYRVREQYPEEFLTGASEVHIYTVQESYEFHGERLFHEAADWVRCTADQISGLSALSYFTGKKIWQERQVPVGILDLSLGGTPVEAWMSREGLKDFPEYLEYSRIYEDDAFRQALLERKEQEERAWQEQIVRLEAQSLKTGRATGRLRIPGYLEEAGLPDFCGCLRLCKDFDVPEELAGQAGMLRFGTLTDSDEIRINGEKIGETGYSYPPRRYPIPDGLLKEGRNEIEVRLVVRDGKGRATYGKPYEIVWERNEAEAIDLQGEWQYEITAVTAPAPEQEFLIRKPTVLYQGMVAPCIPYTIQGVVWYQGESNDQKPENYGELLNAFLADWRRHWGLEHLPFVLIQLPNCGIDIAPGAAWPMIREAQRQAGKLADTAVITCIDLGEDNDLHPLRKRETAERAVRALDAMVYGEACVYMGPVLREIHCLSEGQYQLGFDTMDDGPLLLTEGEELPYGLFELVWEDGRSEALEAVMDGRNVLVRSRKTAVSEISDCEPAFLRYAYQAAPGRILLKNQTGLPASPFEERNDLHVDQK